MVFIFHAELHVSFNNKKLNSDRLFIDYKDIGGLKWREDKVKRFARNTKKALKNPLTIVGWKARVAMGDSGKWGAGRQRKPSEKTRRQTVPDGVNDAILMQCITESNEEGGFSDEFFYSAQKSWYEAAGFFVKFEKNFRPPISMLPYYMGVLDGTICPREGQSVVKIGPSRKHKMYSM